MVAQIKIEHPDGRCWMTKIVPVHDNGSLDDYKDYAFDLPDQGRIILEDDEENFVIFPREFLYDCIIRVIIAR